MTMSYAPAITPCAANATACWLEPHCRSIVVPGMLSGKPAASTALRVMFTDCLPLCVTQPPMTSSMVTGSMPLRSTSALRTVPKRSTG